MSAGISPFPQMKICRPSKRNIFDFLISIIVNHICFAAAARAFVHFSREHHINMKFIARIFHFLYDYIFNIQKFCAIIILVEHTFDPFNWVGVLLLYWISWVCSTFFMQKNGIGFVPTQTFIIEPFYSVFMLSGDEENILLFRNPQNRVHLPKSRTHPTKNRAVSTFASSVRLRYTLHRALFIHVY